MLSVYGVNISSSKELLPLQVNLYHDEIEVISHVVAYFDIASKRLIDDIPQVFETVFTFDFGERLGKTLTTNLNLVGEGGLENCTRYIRDEPDVQATRNDLTARYNILEKAKETMERFFK